VFDAIIAEQGGVWTRRWDALLLPIKIISVTVIVTLYRRSSCRVVW
jgi:hypothetical protein